jgi:RNA polymerase sigma-70 factor (ECF subfamily)
MGEAPATRSSLLVRLRDARDAPAWSQFVALYAPLIHGFACKHGLQDADAADLTQDVLAIVARTMRGLEYDAAKGSFRGWLFTAVRNKLRDFVTRRKPYHQGTGDTGVQGLLSEQPAREAEDSVLWEQEYERRLFHCAAEHVRKRVSEPTWHAFWQTAIDGKNAKEVAAGLKITPAAVYLAKSRVMAQLKREIEELREE